MGLNGDVRMGGHGAQMRVAIHHKGWVGTATGVRTDFAFPDAATGSTSFDLFDGTTLCGRGRATLLPAGNRQGLYTATVTSMADQRPEAVVLSLSLPCAAYAGGTWATGSGEKGMFPKVFAGALGLWRGNTTALTFTTAGGDAFTLAFPAPTPIYLQDDRTWGPTFTLRISAGDALAPDFRRGDQRAFTCLVSAPGGVEASVAQPVVVSRGEAWVPLDYRKDIEAGSALDFSGMGLQDAPAGKHGWLRNEGGHFAFEGLPGVRQRFYGVNLCFTACFPDHATADRLVTRLVRLGYNALRIHHYENWNGVIKGSKDLLALDAAWTERLDYLLFRAMEKGLYVTTDLYTSRPVRWRDIGIDRDGLVPPQVYKNLVGVHAPAFENWKAFARNLLAHVNPHTGRAYRDEPGLPLISLINEGLLTWCWEEIRKEAPMKAAWRKWLGAKRAADPAFAKGVPDDAEKVPAWDNAALVRFMADTEGDLAKRQRAFLRSIGVKALLTSQNCGSHYAPMMAMREACYDYVDDHFYVDHPSFLARPWSLPSRCPNANPVQAARLPPVRCAYTRMPSKPFCITEWNFAGPGMFRGVGGIMTGAMGALQDWDGLWRFAYSHTAESLADGAGHPGYFDVASDPLGQASDRASICLFLRGDMAPLADRLALVVTPDTFLPADGRPVGVVPAWDDAAWQAQVGTAVAPVPAGVKAFSLREQLMREKAPMPLARNPSLALDRAAGRFMIDTPRTAGGFAPEGALAAGPVSFDVGGVPATVWASSLDGQPLPASGRILVTHLTDVQAEGNVYADTAKTTLLKWGTSTPVVRNGSAEVALALAAPGAFEVWALATSGRRMEKVPSRVRDGRLAFTASVKGPHGARMLYEVVRAGR